jgi:hypothetical protein
MATAITRWRPPSRDGDYCIARLGHGRFEGRVVEGAAGHDRALLGEVHLGTLDSRYLGQRVLDMIDAMIAAHAFDR